MTSVAKAILVELKRNNKLMLEYQELPNRAGYLGSLFIQTDIRNAEEALASGDVLKILKSYEKLKGNE